jgi:hypothetical protein
MKQASAVYVFIRKIKRNTPPGLHMGRWEYRPNIRRQRMQAQRISLSVFIRLFLYLENKKKNYHNL